MTKLDKEALTDIESWRAQLLILFDGDCVDGVEEFNRIYKEVYKFAEEKIIPVVPSQLPRMEKMLLDKNGKLFALGENGSRIYFPENRIYIAQSEIIPEPASMALLAGGGFMLIFRQKRRRANERG